MYFQILRLSLNKMVPTSQQFTYFLNFISSVNKNKVGTASVGYCEQYHCELPQSGTRA